MIKLNVVSGFLGAGKTTFILKASAACASKGEKVVIIENEIGETGIDTALISEGGLKVYELLNGCICCTLKADIMTVLAEIKKLEPDRVFMEPSGIFLLESLFEILKWEEIREAYTLCPVITVIDARHFLKCEEVYTDLIGGQVRLADKLVITKTQGIKDISIVYTIQKLRALNCRAEIITGIIDLGDGDMLEMIGKHECVREEQEHEGHKEHGRCCEHGHNERHNHVLSGERESRQMHTTFETLLINPKGVFGREEIQQRLEKLSDGEFGNIIRAKGFVKSSENLLSVNYVDGDVYVNIKLMKVKEALQIIGLNLDREKLERHFE